MSKIVIAYHSGYGHTKKVAEHIEQGASAANASVTLLNVAEINDAGWAALQAADAIVFGAPTYMGGPSAPFKTFADATAKQWGGQAWKDKIAAGFTNSYNMSGDKYSTLHYFMTLAMQHGMIWVGPALPNTATPGAPDAINRLGSGGGLMTQADNAPPEQTPPKGDLESAVLFGRRIAEVTARFGK